MSNSWYEQGLVNIWGMPYIRLSRFESYIESYASKTDRVKMRRNPNIYAKTGVS